MRANDGRKLDHKTLDEIRKRAALLPVCAIANAIGIWIEPPATPDKILKALGKC